MKLDRKGTFKFLNYAGRFEVLDILSRKFLIWKETASKDLQFTRYKDIEKDAFSSGVGSPSSVSEALHSLDEAGFIATKNGAYIVSELGLYVWSLIQTINSVSAGNQLGDTSPLVFFNERTNSRSWIMRASAIIIGANKNLRIATRWWSNFDSGDHKDELQDAFRSAKTRGVKIKMIVDPGISENTLRLLRDDNAEIRFIRNEFLENPPKAMKPVFFSDFNHIMIADENHWLYVFPHKKGEIHIGKSRTDDPIVSHYLVDLFESFWAFASAKKN